MTPDAYLERIGLDPDAVETPDLETLRRLQRAHITTVPFENLAIVGDPYGERDGTGVSLSIPHLYEKIVERDRGGYCFELNGLFHWLLAELGYDVDRVAARVLDDGDARPPANHHTNVVELDRRYVVEVGTGIPMIRQPLPLAGASGSDDPSAHTDDLGFEWRVNESDRPDAEYRTEYRAPEDESWTTRYVFTDSPRELHYFAATNDYLQSAPESPFTGGPIVLIATEDGHRSLSRYTFTETSGNEKHERVVTGAEWHETLVDEFGVRYARE